MTTTVQTMDRQGSIVSSTQLEMDTMEVTSHSGPGLEWGDPQDWGSDDWWVNTAGVYSTGDGLKYVLSIRVTDLGSACGEKKDAWLVDVPVGKARNVQKIFDDKEHAEEYILELQQSGVNATLEDIDETYQSLYCVELLLVPVSIAQSTMEEITSGDADILDGALDSHHRHGDFREYAWDIAMYGHYVPLWSVNGWWYDGEWPEHLIKDAKKQAIPVPQMLGFYLDRRVNALGETGWDWLKRSKAFPAQHEIHKPKKEETLPCDDCGEEKECGVYDTIYNYDVPICKECLEESWIGCTECHTLIPIRPQSWAGVEWIELNHMKYCHDCAGNVLDSTENGFSFDGGSSIKPSDVKDLALNLVGISLGEWEEVEYWHMGWNTTHQDELNNVAAINDHLLEAQPNEEFLLGYSGREQFGVTVSLYKRQKEDISKNVPQT